MVSTIFLVIIKEKKKKEGTIYLVFTLNISQTRIWAHQRKANVWLERSGEYQTLDVLVDRQAIYINTSDQFEYTCNSLGLWFSLYLVQIILFTHYFVNYIYIASYAKETDSNDN